MSNQATGFSDIGLAGFVITVIYNGVPKPLPHVQPDEQVTAVFERALKLFDIRDRPHAYALFTLAGQEIANQQSVKHAGIVAGTELLLREKIVGGG